MASCVNFKGLQRWYFNNRNPPSHSPYEYHARNTLESCWVVSRVVFKMATSVVEFFGTLEANFMRSGYQALWNFKLRSVNNLHIYFLNYGSEKKMRFPEWPSPSKEPHHGLCILKTLANFFKFAICNPC